MEYSIDLDFADVRCYLVDSINFNEGLMSLQINEW